MGTVAHQEPVARESVRVVGRYAIFDELASGGMATVYLGRLTGSGGFARTVAIKSLHPQFAKDPEFVSMFLDEARLAARIRHPNVVPTLDVVASKGEVFLVMEYVQGETLSRLTRGLKALGERAPLPITLRIVADVLQGMHAAHEACDEHGVALHIVHRDVSPQNILVGIDGVARLLDFGIAKAAGRAHTTRDGQIKGKLAYMAPEQLSGIGVTRQTDVYAASVVLWEALTGARLITGDNELDLIAQLLKRQIRRPSELVPDVPRALEEVVMRGLEARPEDRFATAREMCTALAKCGMPEAPSITVGEWVQTLAADALAHRTAKISAIERHPGRVRSLSTYPPEDRTVPAIKAPHSPPKGPDDSLGQHADEPQSKVLAITLAQGVMRGRRTRVLAWIAASALVLLVAGGTFAIQWTVRPGVASISQAPTANAPAVQPEPAAAPSPPLVSLDALPVVSSAHVDPQPRSTTARPAGPSRVSRGAASAAPARWGDTKAANNVFDSRE